MRSTMNRSTRRGSVRRVPMKRPSGRMALSRPAQMNTPFARQQAHLSKCATKYIEFMHNPWGMKDVPCVPSAPALFTRNVYITAKGVLGVGTAGFGFIAVDPIHACHSDGAVIDGNAGQGFVQYSTAAYAGNIVTDSSVAGVNTDLGNSDYVVADFQPVGPTTNTVRVVGAGVRIKYRGTELNRGGSVVAFHDPNHLSTITRTFASVRGDDTAIQLAPDANEGWMHITWGIADNIDADFVPNNQTNGILPNLVLDGTYPMAILIESPPGAPGLFDYEVAVGLEIAGRNVRGKKLSNADAAGFSAAQVIGMIPPLRGGTNPAQNVDLATGLASIHVGQQSGPIAPLSQVQSGFKVDWEGWLDKAISGAIKYGPEIAEAVFSLL